MKIVLDHNSNIKNTRFTFKSSLNIFYVFTLYPYVRRLCRISLGRLSDFAFWHRHT